MVGIPIIEVIIGMIFVYSLLAIIVTQINTVIVNTLNLRAKHLKRAVGDLITDPATQARFMTHPLIYLVKRPLDPNRPLSAQGAETVIESPTTDVQWIEPNIFSSVMVDLVSTQSGTARDLYAPVLRVANTVLDNADKARVRAIVRRIQTTGQGLDELYTLITNLTDAADRQAMLQALSDVEGAQEEFGTDSPELIQLLQGLRQIENPDFQRALDTVLATARTIDEARQRLEQWFDASMEQVTETYKQRMQWVSLIVGFGLAVFLNIDSLQLAQGLWNDPALRETVVTAARSSLETGELASQLELASPEATPQVNLNIEPAPTTEVLTPDDPTILPTSAPITDTDVEQAQQRLNESAEQTAATVEDLLALRLPIGWASAPVIAQARNVFDPDPRTDSRNLWNFSPANNPDHWLGLVIMKIAGILLTTVAVSQGAPFWFDLLNRIARGR